MQQPISDPSTRTHSRATTGDTPELTITDYQSETCWRWVLSDERGNFLADHEVSLDASAPVYRGFRDLPGYLRYHTPAVTEAQALHEVGEWMGEEVFGGLLNALRELMQPPATVVRVSVPPAAQELLFRPFELAHLDGKPFVEHGLRFVYQLAEARPPTTTKPMPAALRVLAVFSLPEEANPLNLRRERYELRRLLDEIAQTRGVAVDLRVLQYGATRQTLADALQEGDGWDIIHFSGHGMEGQLLLEDESGDMDEITADELAPLLGPTRRRLKLLTLSACLSGAATLQAARAQLGLDQPTRDVARPLQPTLLPSLAQTLAQELDCAALAMRYPVGDEFATRMMLSVYRLMLEKHQPLPAALQLATDDALAQSSAAPPLSRVTPILFGARAVDLALTPPKNPSPIERPHPLIRNFPQEPERFMGRLMPMLQASQSLAPESPYRGVLFYGMAGAGKTHCSLELAYRHEWNRFAGGFVWHKAPDQGHDIASALVNFLQDVEAQLKVHDLALTAYADDPLNFQQQTLPDLRALLSQNAVLLVLGNIESLLTNAGQWRDEKWGWLMDALLSHTGASRVVLTSRRLPASLASTDALLRLPIHALSFPESVLLSRELPNLRPLFDTEDGRDLLTRTLNLIQGHPILLGLADKKAGDPVALRQFLDSTGDKTGEAPGRMAFFTTGDSEQSEDDFVAALRNWTTSLTASLPATARLLFHFLCRFEDPDRQSGIIEANWEDFLNRLKDTTSPAAAALTEPAFGLDSSLDLLITSGLVESRTITVSDADDPLRNSQSAIRNLRIHPAVAKAALADADPAVLEAADFELGDFWIAQFLRGLETEMQGGGSLAVKSGKRGVSYLLCTRRWEEAATLLQRVIHCDHTPATLAMALPLLRQIAHATESTDLGLLVAGILATAFLYAGCYSEAEQMLRDLMEKCEAQDDYRSASVATRQLIVLLRRTGGVSHEEALCLTERMADFTRRAGLGPWTQLGDEAQRLQILDAMGGHDEVLRSVQALRGQLITLPEESEMEETVVAWNVRESLLAIGHTAALGLEQWETALHFNSEIVQWKRQRGADEIEIARTLFNNYNSLRCLHRYREARDLLESCRAADEHVHAIPELGRDFRALADLEHAEGNDATAVRFAQVALRFHYQAGEPEDCAISHDNLSNYLAHTQAPPEVMLAHRLAAGVIYFQAGSGGLVQRLSNLANSPLPPEPPKFDEVEDIVEQIGGVKFRDLFERLPRRAPDGDAAIGAVWEIAQQEQARRHGEETQRDAVLSALPPTVLAALEAQDEEALKAALSPEEAQALAEQFAAAGMSSEETGETVDVAQLIASLPLAVRAALEARDVEALNAALGQLSPEEQQRVMAALEATLAQLSPEEAQALAEHLTAAGMGSEETGEAVDVEQLLASIPPAVRDALVAQDEEALKAAMEQLSPEEQQRIMAALDALFAEAESEEDESL